MKKILFAILIFCAFVGNSSAAFAREHMSIEIKSINFSNDEDVDAVGSCVGQHGIRIQAIVDELGDEKIDIVQWDQDPAIFIANALSPSKVIRVSVNEQDKVSRVVVPNNQLSLAIGKEGQNARLAAKLTGWKIDIKSKMQAQGEVLSDEFRTVKITPVKFFSSTLKAKRPKNNPEKNSGSDE